MSRSSLLRFFSALVFIAATAGWTSANAQFSNNPAAATGSVVTTPQVRAELLAHAPEGVAPGQPVWLGLQLTHQKDWHTYWKNPGDSGLPIELTWQLPDGLDVGETAWPVPQRIRVGRLANFGYDGQVLLAAPLQVPAGFKAPASGQVEIRLRATWLACRVECIPEEGSFILQLPVRGSTAMHGAAFAQAQAAQAEDQAKRVSGLDGTGVLSQEQIAQRRYQAEIARANLRQLQTQRRKMAVTAPVSGLILERNVRPGDMSAITATPWFRMARDGQVELSADLASDERDAQ